VRLSLLQSEDVDLSARASRLNALPDNWREHFRMVAGPGKVVESGNAEFLKAGKFTMR
jgi:hypothetical protein